MALSKLVRERLIQAFGITAEEQTAAKELADALDTVLEMRNKYNALLAKIDTDAGVSDTDYTTTLQAPNIVT